MSDGFNRQEGKLEIQGKLFHYTLLKENNKTFVNVADILFERNKNYNLLADIQNILEEKGLITTEHVAHNTK